MKKKRFVFQDVVDCVGVIKMMVSCFLCNLEQVFVVLCGKIVVVFDELGYIFNCVFDIFFNVISWVIGVLLFFFINQVFVEVLCGIESVIDVYGYQIMLVYYGYKLEME